MLYLIGESSQYFYVVSTGDKYGKAIQINKNEIEFITTKVGSGNTIPPSSISATGSVIIKKS